MAATWHPGRVDLVVAAALTVVGQLEIWTPDLVPAVGPDTGSRPFLAVTTLAVSLPVAWRRRAPLVVLVLVLGTLVLQTAVSTPNEGLSTLVASLLAAYGSSAYSPPARAAIAGGVVALGSVGMGEDLSDKVFITIVLGTAWLVGFAVAQRTLALDRAHADNRDLAGRLAEAAARIAESERRTVAGPRPDELATLTAREVEVARAIAQGMSNADIAASLFISEWTVKSHVASILRKLGLRDRAQVVVAAYESGLVTPRAAQPADETP